MLRLPQYGKPDGGCQFRCAGACRLAACQPEHLAVPNGNPKRKKRTATAAAPIEGMHHTLKNGVAIGKISPKWDHHLFMTRGCQQDSEPRLALSGIHSGSSNSPRCFRINRRWASPSRRKGSAMKSLQTPRHDSAHFRPAITAAP